MERFPLDGNRDSLFIITGRKEEYMGNSKVDILHVIESRR